MSEPGLITFQSREAMAARLSEVVECALSQGILRDGRGELAVSGGSTPKHLYELLAAGGLDFGKLGLTLVDERWVPMDHPRSNEAFVRRAFAEAEAAQITGLCTGASTPQQGVDEVNDRLSCREKPFDVVVLGMGEDGHTASWFPHADGLEEALSGDAAACAVTARKSEVTGAEVDRVTLTLSAIKSARMLLLLLSGDGKRAAFEEALEEGPVADMPVRALFRARPDIWVCWAP